MSGKQNEYEYTDDLPAGHLGVSVWAAIMLTACLLMIILFLVAGDHGSHGPPYTLVEQESFAQAAETKGESLLYLKLDLPQAETQRLTLGFTRTADGSLGELKTVEVRQKYRGEHTTDTVELTILLGVAEPEEITGYRESGVLDLGGTLVRYYRTPGVCGRQRSSSMVAIAIVCSCAPTTWQIWKPISIFSLIEQ